MAGLLALGLTTLLSSSATAQPPGISREYTIKAAYLYQFGGFVTWPDKALATADAPFVIGVLGSNPFGTDLDKIARAKEVQARRIEIRRFSTVADYNGCHILFVGKAVDAQQRTAIVGRIGNAPVLVVGETPGFALNGAVVNFLVQRNKVRFEINQWAAEKRGLKISAKLLAIAKRWGTIVGDPTKTTHKETKR